MGWLPKLKKLDIFWGIEPKVRKAPWSQLSINTYPCTGGTPVTWGYSSIPVLLGKSCSQQQVQGLLPQSHWFGWKEQHKTPWKGPTELGHSWVQPGCLASVGAGKIKDNKKWEWKTITSASCWKVWSTLHHVMLLKDLMPTTWTHRPVHSQPLPTYCWLPPALTDILCTSRVWSQFIPKTTDESQQALK